MKSTTNTVAVKKSQVLPSSEWLNSSCTRCRRYQKDNPPSQMVCLPTAGELLKKSSPLAVDGTVAPRRFCDEPGPAAQVALWITLTPDFGDGLFHMQKMMPCMTEAEATRDTCGVERLSCNVNTKLRHTNRRLPLA